MKNMGLEHLVLVNPQCDPLSAAALQMAVHADDILQAARQVATLPEALQGCQRAIATTARDRAGAPPLEAPRAVLPWLLEAPVPAALVFGPEERGLSNVELNYAQRFIRIPSSATYPSLNLAQAVAVCCYELYATAEASAAPALSSPGSSNWLETASLDALEAYYQQLEAVLLRIGYLYPHTTASRMAKFRHLFNRAQPSPEELAMLRGILSQIQWALNRQSPENSDLKVEDAHNLP
jgi:tRNA/rRNA methyltransferase